MRHGTGADQDLSVGPAVDEPAQVGGWMRCKNPKGVNLLRQTLLKLFEECSKKKCINCHVESKCRLEGEF